LPRPVVRRAEVLLKEYEAGSESKSGAEASPRNQGAAHTARMAELTRAILDLDPNSLSPVEALMKLFELRKLAEKEDTRVRAVKTA
jgi:DNA mismatch repair ATPase MutS